jgi:acetate kinase
MMTDPLLVLNCGSSSIKFALFDAAAAAAAVERQGRGHHRSIAEDPGGG